MPGRGKGRGQKISTTITDKENQNPAENIGKVQKKKGLVDGPFGEPSAKKPKGSGVEITNKKDELLYSKYVQAKEKKE